MSLKGLSKSGNWPSGNPRFYYREAGKPAVPMPDAPEGSDIFVAAWLTARGTKVLPPQRAKAGTISELIERFRASQKFLNLQGSTRAYYRRHLEVIRATWGVADARSLGARHIKADLEKLQPNPANQRLKVWRGLMAWAYSETSLIEANPARDIAKRTVAPSDGFTPWTMDDVAKFRDHWSTATPQRLFFELLLRTGASVCDAVKIGPGHIKDGWLSYARQKSREPAICPMTAQAAPAWFGFDDHLDQCLALAPRHLVYVVTAYGKPRSEKAASQWFASAARAAGIEGKTAHGIRKLKGALMTENGASQEQRMAILGHDSPSEARRYSKSADLKKIVSGTGFSNSAPVLPTSSDKAEG